MAVVDNAKQGSLNSGIIAVYNGNRNILVLSDEAKDMLFRLVVRYHTFFKESQTHKPREPAPSSSQSILYPSLRPLSFAEQQQFQQYYSYVIATVDGMIRKAPRTVEKEELLSAGAFGLMRAIQHYDAAKGDFISYARERIGGEIHDYLRSLREHYNRGRQRFGMYFRTERTLLKEGIEPSVENIAARLELSADYVRRVKEELAYKTVYFEDLVNFEYDSAHDETFHSNAEDHPDMKIVFEHIAALDLLQRLGYLSAAISSLEKEKVKRAIDYNFIERMKQKAIARLLAVKESRVSQLLTEGVAVVKRRTRNFASNYHLDSATLDEVVRRCVN